MSSYILKYAIPLQWKQQLITYPKKKTRPKQLNFCFSYQLVQLGERWRPSCLLCRFENSQIAMLTSSAVFRQHAFELQLRLDGQIISLPILQCLPEIWFDVFRWQHRAHEWLEYASRECETPSAFRMLSFATMATSTATGAWSWSVFVLKTEIDWIMEPQDVASERAWLRHSTSTWSSHPPAPHCTAV